MSSLAYTRRGTGEPLVLLHGIGSARQAWDPVVPALAQRYDVIAVDLPGFGESPPLPAQVEPAPAEIAGGVARLLDELGLTAPHVAGNSLGGWVALELAAIHPLASLTLLSPAGLWGRRTPRYVRVSLRVTRWMARHATGALCRLMRYRLARIAVLGQTHGQPARIDPAHARTAIRAMAAGPGFEATYRATVRRGYRAVRPVRVPVTVAFGSRDRLLLERQARRRDQLPAGAVLTTVPGWGHTPMADDPETVAAFIATAARTRPRPRTGQRRPDPDGSRPGAG
ncbi:alpha/beta fold hydrolase [Jidongwangia harbinensis]|uniref:alpha/beta fold hydrolase n=1 Tax=Jidongwangia harbinensis TaxID=2878561 RepID=UPI001CD95BF7|nr:alpha/beta hydrolase [Jidongwangia harbinensis]MCA2213930.1 alpha/beta fold hydrolase [Jidongwangia harbinensis]